MTLALDYGAGLARTQDTASPELVVVATPPDVVGAVVTQMRRGPTPTLLSSMWPA